MVMAQEITWKHMPPPPHQPDWASDKAWVSWMCEMVALHQQLQAKAHKVKAAEAHFWKSVALLMSTLEHTYGNSLASFVVLGGKVQPTQLLLLLLLHFNNANTKFWTTGQQCQCQHQLPSACQEPPS